MKRTILLGIFCVLAAIIIACTSGTKINVSVEDTSKVYAESESRIIEIENGANISGYYEIIKDKKTNREYLIERPRSGDGITIIEIIQ